MDRGAVIFHKWKVDPRQQSKGVAEGRKRKTHGVPLGQQPQRQASKG